MHQLCTLRGPSVVLSYTALPALGLGSGVRSCGRTCKALWTMRWEGMKAAPKAAVAGSECGGGVPPPIPAAIAPPEGLEVVKVAVNLGEAKAFSAVALVAAQRSHTYGQLLQSACALASQLEQSAIPKQEEQQEKNGAGSGVGGQRIGIMAKPCAEFVAGLWATWMSGAIAVPLALSYPAAELMHVLTDADVALVIATDEFREVLEPLATSCSVRFLPLSPVPHQQEQEQQQQSEEEEPNVVLSRVHSLSSQVRGDEPALIIYTSGTTGKPKGVVHTHSTLASQAQILSQAWAYSPQDRLLHCLPLHHVHGLINALLAPLHAGATVEFLPKFSTRAVWQRWRESYPSDQAASSSEDAITVFTGVPTVYVRLLQGYDAMDAACRAASASAAARLRLMMCGSSALPLPVMERWESITGHRLLERYGMTEFGMAISNPLHGERRAGFVGQALPGVELKIEQIGEEEWQGGELCVKSPSLFKEYWRQPQVTKHSFSPDGFFRTGDSVLAQDGYIKILGRTSVDILKSGGYKLSALEIEGVLLEHPAIHECAVLGVPDPEYGEIITAIVVPDARIAAQAAARAEPPLSLHQLRTWASDKMAAYKMPQRLLVWEELPRNAMGKVNKKQLTQLLLQPLGGGGGGGAGVQK